MATKIETLEKLQMGVNIKLRSGSGTTTTYNGVNSVAIPDTSGNKVTFTLGGMQGGYNVKFISDGNDYAFYSVARGKSIPAPPEKPTKATKTFLGWATTNGGTTYQQFPYTPNDDVTLYASFGDYDSTLNNNTWSVISSVSTQGLASSVWSVGDRKTITLNGNCGAKTYSNVSVDVYILGFNHNSATEGSGITFGGFKTSTDIDIALDDTHYDASSEGGELYFNINHWGSSTSPFNTNYGGWAASDLRYDILGSTNNAPTVYGSTKTISAQGTNPSSTCATSPKANTLMSCLPSALRSVMKRITKYTDNKGNVSNIEPNVSSTYDYLPLMSEYEVFGARAYANQYEYANGKQVQYDYYAIGGRPKIKYKESNHSTVCYWWLRSPYYSDSFSFCTVHDDGGANYNNSNVSYALSPVFLV